MSEGRIILKQYAVLAYRALNSLNGQVLNAIGILSKSVIIHA